ncbi:MAG: FAD-binding protein, partial [Thermoplasmata archaeon]|nr:FAD-binding protein [Thermoplasmata archaeon]
RPGERVSVISMGPPGASTALREALALGADRAILVTDPKLAGSDSLATSRTLARALGRVGHELTLAGSRSTDSDTGQVGPQLAGLLGVGVVSGARRIVRDDGGDGVEIVADTETGWRRVRVTPPAVVTVGEKITKVRKVTPPELESVSADRVEMLTLDALDISEALVGLLGSPTVVDSLDSPAPTRRGRTFVEGTAESRVAEAVQALELLPFAQPTAPGGPPLAPPLPQILADDGEVIVLVTGADGRPSSAALSVLAEARRQLPGYWPSAVWAGPSITDDESRNIAEAGATRGYHLLSPEGRISSRRLSLALQTLLSERRRAAAVLFTSDAFGREVAGQLSAREGLGLTGDAVSMRAASGSRLMWGKPSFGGNVVAEIVSRTRPSLATVRASPGGSRTFEGALGRSPITWTEWPMPTTPESVEELDFGVELVEGMGDLDTARVAVCVGMGLGTPDHLPQILPALHRWGAALAGTRRVVDAGWLPRQLQVGLTGRAVSPDLVLLLGVSGSSNQLVGWRRAGAILALDVNPQAPVFAGVDVGIVGRWEEVWPLLAKSLDPIIERINATPR